LHSALFKYFKCESELIYFLCESALFVSPLTVKNNEFSFIVPHCFLRHCPFISAHHGHALARDDGLDADLLVEDEEREWEELHFPASVAKSQQLFTANSV
jgi:hypothetical protein